MLLHEDAVKNAVIAHLAKRKYLPTKIKTISQHGADIVARHQQYGRYFVVEVKGDPSPKATKPNSGREVRFLQGLGQLLTRINPDNGYYYGLACPVSYRSKAIQRLNSSLLKKLKMHLFFVNEKYQVEHVTWKEFRLLKSK